MMDKYEMPIAVIMKLSPVDIITTSPNGGFDDGEPGIELPELEFPRA